MVLCLVIWWCHEIWTSKILKFNFLENQVSKIKNVFPGFTSARLEKQAGKNVADATFKWTDWLLFPLKFTVSYFHVSQTFSSIYNFSKTSIIFGKLLRVLQEELASEQICWFSYDYEITNNFRKLCKIYSSHKTFIKHKTYFWL